MYRTAARRLLAGATASNFSNVRVVQSLNLQASITPSLRFSTSTNSQSPTGPTLHVDPINPTLSDSSSTSTSSAEGPPRQERRRPRVEYQDEQARVLKASLGHVVRTLTIFPFSFPNFNMLILNILFYFVLFFLCYGAQLSGYVNQYGFEIVFSWRIYTVIT